MDREQTDGKVVLADEHEGMFWSQTMNTKISMSLHSAGRWTRDIRIMSLYKDALKSEKPFLQKLEKGDQQASPVLSWSSDSCLHWQEGGEGKRRGKRKRRGERGLSVITQHQSVLLLLTSFAALWLSHLSNLEWLLKEGVMCSFNICAPKGHFHPLRQEEEKSYIPLRTHCWDRSS